MQVSFKTWNRLGFSPAKFPNKVRETDNEKMTSHLSRFPEKLPIFCCAVAPCSMTDAT